MPDEIERAKATAGDAIADLADAIAAKRVADALGDRPPVEPDPDPKPTPSGEFTIFEDINYRGRPDLQAEFGMVPLKVHYESAFFDNRRRAGDGDYSLPANSRIVQAARSAPNYSCIDIERWWSFSDNDLDDRAAPAYEHVAEVYDDALDPGDLFGFYSTIPIRSLNKIGQPDWKETNDRLKGLGDLVDMTFPSLYALVDDDERWPDYARANIAEAKRIAPGKPCYPFLWPVYHPNAKAKKGRPIPPHIWRRQLEICREFADGVVIWTLSKTKTIDFKDIPPWWQETVDFARSLR